MFLLRKRKKRKENEKHEFPKVPKGRNQTRTNRCYERVWNLFFFISSAEKKCLKLNKT